MKQNFFAIGFNATNAPTIIRILIQGGLNIKEINCFPNHLLNTKIEMIKLFHILFAATCIGSMFVYSINSLQPTTENNDTSPYRHIRHYRFTLHF